MEQNILQQLNKESGLMKKSATDNFIFNKNIEEFLSDILFTFLQKKLIFRYLIVVNGGWKRMVV